MISSYLKIAWRNISRHRIFSTINIMGLALGLTCSLLIFLWVQDEKRVDGFHVNGEKLFQIYERNYFDGKIEASYSTQPLLPEELKRLIPEIKAAASVEWATVSTLEVGDKINKMTGSFAGEDFFNMFSFPLIQGSASSVLTTLEGIVISRKMAEQFFGSPEQAMGKTIRYENWENLQVTGVFENIPNHSSFQFDFLRSWVAFKKENSSWINNWGNTDGPTFVQLREDADWTAVESKIKDFVYHFTERTSGFRKELALQPFTEKYLHSNFKDGQIVGGRIEYVRLFSFIALFIVLIACINFMNLATARSVKRAREVGIRKVVGAARFTLMGQFLGEAIVLTFCSVIIANVLSALLLPAFNNLTGKQLVLPVSDPNYITSMLGLIVAVGLVAGSYPAVFLSALNPNRVLKGSLKFNLSSILFRQSLVVFQFVLAIVMITGMLVVNRQFKFIKSRSIGYNRENLLYIPIEGELSSKYALFKDEALKLPGIIGMSKIRQAPTHIGNHTGDIRWIGKDPNLVTSFVNTTVGYDFVKTMGMQLVKGRDFSPAFGMDSLAYLINETALARIGYQDPIGKSLTWGRREGKIIGVLKDFHVASMHQAIEPMIIGLHENRPWGTMLIRTQAGQVAEALAGLEKLYKSINPKFPFTYRFSDLEFANLYRSEQIVSQLSNYFAVLSIFISCLGLFGLSMFAVGQRIKEISVRKILGATVSNIFAVLSGNFLKPVILALGIAIPLSWYMLTSWLNQFAYKITLDWSIYLIAGILTAMTALFTISFQVIRAALGNPIKTIRNDQ